MDSSGKKSLTSLFNSIFKRTKPSQPSPSPVPPLPFLPNDRPFNLSRPASPNDADPQLSSPFFRLPYEIREQIYRLAFGGRTLHVDLQYRKRDYFKSPESWSESEAWQLCGTVCRCQEGASIDNDKFCTETVSISDASTACYLTNPNSYGLGWVLSCRQSYIETIDLLYSFTTFRLNSPGTILHLPKLLLPQRLASMTSLEIFWGEYKITTYLSLLEIFNPKTFPAMKKLSINCKNLHPMTMFPDTIDYLPDLRTAALDPIDQILISYSLIGAGNFEVLVTFPMTLWECLRRLVTAASLDDERQGGMERDLDSLDEFWRIVGKNCDLDVEGGLRGGDASSDELRYLVRRGRDDRMR